MICWKFSLIVRNATISCDELLIKTYLSNEALFLHVQKFKTKKFKYFENKKKAFKGK